MKFKKVLYVLLALIAVGIMIFLFLCMPIGVNNDTAEFVVKPGENKVVIATNLAQEGFVKSKLATLFYLFLNPNTNLQAGTYVLNKGNSTFDIIKQIGSGDTKKVAATIRITFKEGFLLVDYARQIEETFDHITSEDFIKRANNVAFLKTLIDKYDFLTNDILNDNIYMPLEGYLAPDTYEFYENASIDNIITKMLDNTKKRFDQLDMSKTKFNMHELLTLASMIEKESSNSSDRRKVSQVFQKRLDIDMSLGSDVTAWYGYMKGLASEASNQHLALKDNNAYNTRILDKKGLPVGPITNPGFDSMKAVLEPSDTNYLYFVASLKTGEEWFFENSNGFSQKCSELRAKGEL